MSSRPEQHRSPHPSHEPPSAVSASRLEFAPATARRTSLETAGELPSEGDPELDSMGLERRRLVQSALAALPPEQREAITLAYFWGLSQSEIAERMHAPLGTVKARIRIGMTRLCEHLAPHEEGLAL